MEKSKKKKNKKFRPMGKVWGEAWLDMGLNFLFFFPMVFCSLAKTSRKPKKQKKTKSSDPWARSGERPGWGHGSELFVFFVFLVFPWFFAVWPKPRENQKKSSDPWARSGERPGRGHGSELFFFHGFLQFGQNLEKTKKNKKFRPMGKVWGEAWLGTWV